MANIDPDIDLTESRIDGYVDLDLGASGEIAQELNRRIERELDAERLILTDCLGEQPAHITPQMNSWYSSNIAPMRGLALSAIKGRFEKHKKAFLLESKLGAIREDLLQKKRSFYLKEREQHKNEYATLDVLKGKLESIDSDFEAKRAEYGRMPVYMRKPFYVALLALLAVPEFFINFESFANLSWASPFIASGITMIVAVAIAFSGHIQGSIIRQWDYYFGEHRRQEHSGKAWRLLGLGNALLLLVLGAVYYARDSYILQTYVDLGDGSGPNKLWLIGGSIFGNIIVFLIGAVIAWYTHDEDPDYPEIMLQHKKAKEAFDKLNDKLARYVNQELARLSADARKSEEIAVRADKAQKQVDEYSENRKFYEAIAAQDKRVIALFDDYRSRLMAALRGKNTDIIMAADDARKESIEVSIDHYLAQELKLKTL